MRAILNFLYHAIVIIVTYVMATKYGVIEKIPLQSIFVLTFIPTFVYCLCEN